jgi:hypothetical protein
VAAAAEDVRGVQRQGPASPKYQTMPPKFTIIYILCLTSFHTHENFLEHLLTRVNLNVFKFEFEHFYLDTCELEHFYLDMCELEHFWYIRSLPTLTENQIQIFEINIVSSIVIFVDRFGFGFLVQ